MSTRGWLLALVIVAGFVPTHSAQAQQMRDDWQQIEGTTRDPYAPRPRWSFIEGSSRKLGRGVANVLTAPGELFRQPYFVSRRDGGIGGSFTGITKGVIWTVARAGSGLYDVFTFPLPLPKNFGPLLKPEFVYAHGDWTPPGSE